MNNTIEYFFPDAQDFEHAFIRAETHAIFLKEINRRYRVHGIKAPLTEEEFYHLLSIGNCQLPTTETE